ncbi:hypothetical protein SAMN05421754_101546 [Nitrosomonas sp. Nm58]|nr:hypothetical protein SAMN05421754_101546 [Nitrosomonas sp. Nm58]
MVWLKYYETKAILNMRVKITLSNPILLSITSCVAYYQRYICTF